MAQTLKLTNFPDINIKSAGRLMQASPASTNPLTVENSSNFATNDILILGDLGSAGSEKLTVQSLPSATQIQTAVGNQLQHYQYDIITSLFGDQIQVYRAPNANGYQPADTSFAVVGSPINIQVNQLFTFFVDNTSGDFWYKY